MFGQTLQTCQMKCRGSQGLTAHACRVATLHAHDTVAGKQVDISYMIHRDACSIPGRAQPVLAAEILQSFCTTKRHCSLLHSA